MYVLVVVFGCCITSEKMRVFLQREREYKKEETAKIKEVQRNTEN